jgi:hypothetical protein
MDSNIRRARQQEALNEQQLLFYRVVDAYAATATIPPVAAVQHDDELPRPKVLTPGCPALHFRCDTERATARVLTGEPAMQRAWFALVAGENVDPKTAREVITRCGRIYAERGLDPLVYFKAERKGSAESYRRGAAR